MTLVLTMLAVLAGFFALMLALDPRRRKRAAYGATVALTAGAFGLADNIPTVGGDALAQPGCDWNVGVMTLTCPRIYSTIEIPPPFEENYGGVGGYGGFSGYGAEDWGPVTPSSDGYMVRDYHLPQGPMPQWTPPEQPSTACTVLHSLGTLSIGAGLYALFAPEPVFSKVTSAVLWGFGAASHFGGLVVC